MIIGTIKEIWRYPVKSMTGERLEACTLGPLGIPADRGWALRDETTREITNGKRIPQLMKCAARYVAEPSNGSIPNVRITFPDGTEIDSSDPGINGRLSEVFQKKVTLWPRQPASNKEHYRRRSATARLMAPLLRSPGFRSLLPQLTRLPGLNDQLRGLFSRESNEPVPDISLLPAEVLEFTSPLGTYFDAYSVNILTTASLNKMETLNPTAIWDVRRFRPNFLIETVDGVEDLVEATWGGKTLRIGTAEIKGEIPCARCGMTTHAQDRLPKDPSVLRSIVKDADQNLGLYASVLKPGEVKLRDPIALI
ncbi:MAG TPA: MOSC N-terminal beta barrel domain-containing protein [Pyrinomonadaceae bacterium]|nr:MOSC N-terminal beta barrel domain-containing protein [Pyrinomonadaceae bacterium]